MPISRIKSATVFSARLVNDTARRVAHASLSFNKVAVHDFGEDHPLKNPDIHVAICDAGRTQELPAPSLLGVDEKDLRTRLDNGDLCFVSYDGTLVVGYDWYAKRPIPFSYIERTPFWLHFGPTRAHNYMSFTVPGYRGRGIAPDRWRVAHRELRTHGLRGTGYSIAIGNFASLQAARKMTGVTWIGYLVYARVRSRHMGWLSPGCRAEGVMFWRESGRSTSPRP